MTRVVLISDELAGNLADVLETHLKQLQAERDEVANQVRETRRKDGVEPPDRVLRELAIHENEIELVTSDMQKLADARQKARLV